MKLSTRKQLICIHRGYCIYQKGKYYLTQLSKDKHRSIIKAKHFIDVTLGFAVDTDD